MTELIFPKLIYLDDFDNDFKSYFDAVYHVFESHFITSHPNFQKTRVAVQKFPLVDGMHRTFYHVTHEGKDEQNRKPDFRRMERIRFPKFVIEGCPHNELLVWTNKRGRDNRVLIFNQVEGYLTVLTARKGYYLFWTAYYIEYDHQRRKYIKEYEAYKKANTA